MPSPSQRVLGIDVGGTFTDAVVMDAGTGEIRHSKVSTTPQDQSEGTLAAIPALGLEVPEIDRFAHGTTVGINALLERGGALTGLICTEGTRDLLDVGRFMREPSHLYDPTWVRPHQLRPVIHRRHIREVSARIRYDGSEHVELDDDQVRREAEFLRDEGIESVAVCLLNSYVDLEHERRIVAIVKEVMPDAYVQWSQVRPVVGEYSRTAAVVLDAYTGPVVSRYLRRLASGLREQAYEGPALIMQMNGGVRTLERTAEDFPAYTMVSGPVAGLLGAEYYAGHWVESRDLACMDIGGTSTDIGLVIDGSAQAVDDWEAEWALPLGMPAIDVRSIGAGGGSLLQVDALGTVAVGPESAGADPGPVAYGRGGREPTVTDAHVVMGTLRPNAFLGGRMELDVEGAFAAVQSLAERLHMDPYRLAAGSIELMNAQVESALSQMIFERGTDVRNFTLFAYGGAGALHAVQVARAAGIKEVVVPQLAGGFSALGLATAPPKVERSLSRVESIDAISIEELGNLFSELERGVNEELQVQGVAAEDIAIRRTMAGMYTGQGFANELELQAWPITEQGIVDWKHEFDALYDRLYGYSAPEMGVTVATLTVSGTGPRSRLFLPPLESGGSEPPAEAVDVEGELRHQDGSAMTATFYHRDALRAGNEIAGPAVIEDDMTTIFLPQDCAAKIDEYGNVRVVV
jgi:N-methylhydantoinase A